MPNFTPEIVSQQSKFYDFMLARYTPLNNPIGKYKSANLLYKTFYIAGANDTFNDCITELRKVLGSDETLCIAKFKKNKFSWEIYFYRSHNLQFVTIENIIFILKKYFKINIDIDHLKGKISYCVFSFDIDQRKEINNIDFYPHLKNGLSHNFDSTCYRFDKTGIHFKNSYKAFYKLNNIKEIYNYLLESVPNINISHLRKHFFFNNLSEIRSLHFGEKQNSNGIYYNGINIQQFLVFLKDMNFSLPLQEYIIENKMNFDHLLFDVAVDYKINNKGEFQILGTGFYGTF